MCCCSSLRCWGWWCWGHMQPWKSSSGPPRAMVSSHVLSAISLTCYYFSPLNIVFLVHVRCSGDASLMDHTWEGRQVLDASVAWKLGIVRSLYFSLLVFFFPSKLNPAHVWSCLSRTGPSLYSIPPTPVLEGSFPRLSSSYWHFILCSKLTEPFHAMGCCRNWDYSDIAIPSALQTQQTR